MRLLANLLLTASLAAALSAATVDGIKIHSSSAGKGPKTVILVHGWTCDETTWNSQVPVLSKEFRVITLDLPGHGQSGAPKDGKLTMELFARAVEAVRKDSKADRVVVVGHSMGTPVVIEYARLYPEHTAALVFVDGLVNLTPPAAGSGVRVPNPAQVGGPDGLKGRETMIRGMFSASTTPDMQKHILSMMLGAPESTAVGAMQATFDPAYWKGDVFNEPVLGLYADHSRSGDRAYMKTHFPNMDYEEIAGTGHFLMLEKPEEFNRMLIAFLDKQSF
ncbi:MAG TPA: alpha/beta hydrolase [Bryobacteraceae bacterium]|jgi:pimeloyl-ACP methyl ester carboxylesterase|nr:alpha/beta hydrolase [Bryobacteraceae bacterium]